MRFTREILLLALSTAIGMIGASRLSADHVIVQQHADALACQMEELRDVFRSQFRRAGNYPELRSVAWDIRSSGRRIGRLARSGRDLCEVRAELDSAAGCLRTLELEVANARFRSDQGLDPPLNGCTRHVDLKLATARETIRCMAQLVNGQPVVMVPGGWQAQRPPLDLGYPGYPSPYDNGQDFRGPADPGNFDSYPGGPIPYHGNGAPMTSPAPGYAPQPTPAPPRGTLPPGNSHDQYEEIEPPLNPTMSGLGNPYGQNRFPSTDHGRPIGLYGQRGNGVDLSSGGVTLRLGGAAIRIR